MYSAFQRAALSSNSTLKKQKVPGSRCSEEAGMQVSGQGELEVHLFNWLRSVLLWQEPCLLQPSFSYITFLLAQHETFWRAVLEIMVLFEKFYTDALTDFTTYDADFETLFI